MLLVIVALPVLGWCVAAAALDAHGRRVRPRPGTWDAIVVAGCRVLPGGVPSASLRRRAACGVSLWREGRAPVLVFTGGKAGASSSEAEAAASVACELGVPDDAIVIEDQSISTEENAARTAAMISARRVLLVTDCFHVFRATRVFARSFDEVGASATVPSPRARVEGSLREVASVAAYWIMRRL
jgi:uncharacterized SAM-binding protein YcdF (DUF218 family)